LTDAGITCRTDSEEQYHMHNKFMVVDSLFLVTGSFNWTFQAAKSNQENVVVMDGRYYIEKYDSEFNKLWAQFAGNKVEVDEYNAAKTIQTKFRKNKAKKQDGRKQSNYNNGWN
jgi:phosphatidylserine/phosphatidylglycerophosphate/cardiolipin synthase-like enzyme